ncbi:hypothetical protein [Flyfo microvirus Tbat2_95]|nr:hypothetical protein [Flyfo microvirus Tbat2_95]
MPSVGYRATPFGEIINRSAAKAVYRPINLVDAPIQDHIPYGPPVIRPLKRAKPVNRTFNKQLKNEPRKESPETVREKHCKTRPENNRPKGGSGAGPRKFIPWCGR